MDSPVGELPFAEGGSDVKPYAPGYHWIRQRWRIQRYLKGFFLIQFWRFGLWHFETRARLRQQLLAMISITPAWLASPTHIFWSGERQFLAAAFTYT